MQKKLDFCDEAAKIDKNCPLLAGDQFLQHTVQLPKEIPPVRNKIYFESWIVLMKQQPTSNCHLAFELSPEYLFC